MIEQYNIRDKVKLILEKRIFDVKTHGKLKKGWETAFKEMSENGDDQLLFNILLFDETNLPVRSIG